MEEDKSFTLWFSVQLVAERIMTWWLLKVCELEWTPINRKRMALNRKGKYMKKYGNLKKAINQ